MLILYSQAFGSSCILIKTYKRIQALEDKAKKLRWQCRRGMLELDMMLMPFIDGAFASLTDKQQADFEALLNYEDSELFPWLMLRESPSDPDMQSIVKLIVDYARQS